jgi:hypothetical protein
MLTSYPTSDLSSKSDEGFLFRATIRDPKETQRVNDSAMTGSTARETREPEV